MSLQPPETSLAARCAVLAAENKRLSMFAQTVFRLSLAAQNGNALPVVTRIHELARDVSRGACLPGCLAEHPPAIWAAMLGKHRATIYRWMEEGRLRYKVAGGGRRISHAQMDECLARDGNGD